jgi:release factor glutamine methyltransferase
MMSADRAERLRRWHDAAVAGSQRDEAIVVEVLGLTLVVPPGVYAPNPLGLAETVAQEVTSGDRVLDMGTGSGVNGLVAAAVGGDVLGVDVNPEAVACAAENADRNGLSSQFEARLSDLFAAVEGQFDVLVFDPPFRWFRARSMAERGMADENYAALTQFFAEVGDHLAAGGRVLLAFGTTGDIDYLQHLIAHSGLTCQELRRVDGEKEGFPVAYFAYRLTREVRSQRRRRGSA